MTRCAAHCGSCTALAREGTAIIVEAVRGLVVHKPRPVCFSIRKQSEVFLSRDCTERLISAARELGVAAGRLTFSKPVAYVYNPLEYAWEAHELYLRTYAGGSKCVVFLGMNPGPFGMVQTGVPFGEVTAVRDWLRICAKVGRPAREHPRRPVTGSECPRSEVSGQRLWGLFAEEFGAARDFFREHLVINYCPLSFLEESGRNRTPDKLRRREKAALFEVCDAHLREAVDALKPQWLIGIGDFAAQRARSVIGEQTMKIGRILHPSPASPMANRDWKGTARRELEELGVWARKKPGPEARSPLLRGAGRGR